MIQTGTVTNPTVAEIEQSCSASQDDDDGDSEFTSVARKSRCSTCQLMAVTWQFENERLRKGDEATNKSFMDTTETIGSIPGRDPVSESCTHETWNRL